MNCPVCNFEDTKVIDSRLVEDGQAVRRRRECQDCGYRFTTYERINKRQIVVIKKDQSSEPFDSNKLMRGLMVATAKRNVSVGTLESIIKDIENSLRSSNCNEIKSDVLGDMVLARLRDVDDLAYIRFASVYKDFKSVDEFATEIKDLHRDQKKSVSE